MHRYVPSAIAVARAMVGAVSGTQFEATVRLSVAIGASALAILFTNSVAAAVLGACQKLTSQTAETFAACAGSIVACTMTRAVIRACFDAAVAANKGILADAREVHAESVSVAIVFTFHLAAGSSLPSLGANAGAVRAVAMLGAFVGTHHFVAGDSLPVWIAHALRATSLCIALTHTVHARVAAWLRTVLARPERAAHACCVQASTVTGASGRSL